MIKRKKKYRLISMERHSYTLVLAGGGAKGAYQIGVWKALLEEGIHIGAVAGTSVGALNSALVATGDFKKAESLWKKITFSDIVAVPDRFCIDGNLDMSSSNIRKFIRYIFKSKGLVTRPLYKLIRSSIDEKKIRHRMHDFGIVTYSLTDMEPIHLFLDDIPKGKLPGFLLASAAMPIFRTVKIDGKMLTDGGVSDNMPYEMMKQRGYKNIIAVNMSALGISREPDTAGTNTIYIKNSLSLSNELDFQPESLRRSMEIGYLDTRKVFSHLCGTFYFLKQVNHLEKKICDKLMIFLKKNKIRFRSRSDAVSKKADAGILRQFLPDDMYLSRYPGISFLECAARSLNIEQAREYTAEELAEEVKWAFKRIASHEEWKKMGCILARRIRNKRKSGRNYYALEEPLDYQTMALALNKGPEYMIPDTVRILFPHAQAARLFLYSYYHKPSAADKSKWKN